MQVLGWLVVFAAVTIAWIFYRRSTVLPSTPTAPTPPNRAIALGAARRIDLLQALLQLPVRGAVGELSGLVEDALGEVVPQAVLDLDARVLLDRLAHHLAEVGV